MWTGKKVLCGVCGQIFKVSGTTRSCLVCHVIVCPHCRALKKLDPLERLPTYWTDFCPTHEEVFRTLPPDLPKRGKRYYLRCGVSGMIALLLFMPLISFSLGTLFSGSASEFFYSPATYVVFLAIPAIFGVVFGTYLGLYLEWRSKVVGACRAGAQGKYCKIHFQ